MINLKALIVGFFTVIFVIILLFIKIRDISAKKRKIKERRDGSEQRFKKKN